MNKIISIIKRIETSEDKRKIVWIMDSKSMRHEECNLPYKKSLEDWNFYSRSIKIALKQ